MTLHLISRRAALALLVAAGFAGTAAAHHGWSWTDDATFTLTGTIEEVFIGNPHAALMVRAEDGVWRVDLAPPSQTVRAGFTDAVAKRGDAVTVIGHRSSDRNARHMKGVRVQLGGRNYDVYPDRVRNL
jgi:hypothetical protein